MPLITSCPECSTQFIVTKELLKAYGGKVRCGTCNHVFNAKEYLVKSAKPKKTTPTKIESVLEDVKLNEENDENYIEIDTPSNLQNDFLEETKAEKTAKEQLTSPSAVNDLSLDERLSRKSKKPFSWLLLLFSLLLLLALLSQLAYFMRTQISANYPQFKPWLNLACQKIGCSIDLPKNIDLLTIDDSDMQEHLDYQNVLQFSSTLINHANVAQAYPSIELTLTNTDDEAVLRRTFKANDYLAKEVVIENGIAPKEEVRIKLNMNTEDIAVAGYRVTLNY